MSSIQLWGISISYHLLHGVIREIYGVIREIYIMLRIYGLIVLAMHKYSQIPTSTRKPCIQNHEHHKYRRGEKRKINVKSF